MSTIPPKKYPRLSQKWFRQNPVRIFVVAGIAVAFLWAGSALILWPAYCDIAKRGQFGDQFGAINALFSGLAFAGIVVSLFLQRRDLSLQRRDLKMQRVELQKSREEFEQQNFQGIFFGLMKHQQDLFLNPKATVRYLKSNSVSDLETINESGHTLFLYLRQEVKKILVALGHPEYIEWSIEYADSLDQEMTTRNYDDPDFDSRPYIKKARIGYTVLLHKISRETHQAALQMNRVERCRLAYAILFQKYNYVLSPFFRHLYHIMRFIKASQDQQLKRIARTPATKPNQELATTNEDVIADFSFFSQFLQAQLSPQVLYLLFFNTLCFEEHLVPLIKEFNILENLDEEDLGGIKSGEVHGITFKSRKNLIQKAIDISKKRIEEG
jgi:hypothetical protein